jgi:ABC-type amino acid transport substrate-binding protein
LKSGEGEIAMPRFRSLAVSTILAALASIGGAGLAAADSLDAIKENQKIRLAVRADAPPFSAMVDGKPTGYSVALCEAVAAELKTQLELTDLAIEYVTVTAEDRFDAITGGKADLLCEATTATLSRRDKVDFSVPTFVSGAGLVIRADGPQDIASLAGKKIGVLGGTTTEESLKATLAGANITAEVVPAATHDEGIATIERAETDAYFADRTILRYILESRTMSEKLILAENYLTVEPYALALPLGDHGLRLAVDRALSRLYRSGKVADIFRAAFGPNAKPTALQRGLYTISGLPE